jgi:hypothetical protein
MPRIHDQILDCVFYLYPSVESAMAGEAAGGAGFFAAVPSVHPKQIYIYGITNRHVIDEAYSPVIRVNNRLDGKTIIPLGVNNWVPHRDGDDLAAVVLGGMDISSLQIRAIETRRFITKEMLDGLDIGPGDEVYMVGRFVHYEGRKRNMPSVRSGIISVMANPDEGIEFYEGSFKQEAFLVEMRSLSGYSGSPVIFQIPLHLEGGRNIKPPYKTAPSGPYLLGVDCGNFRYYDKVFEVEWVGGEKRYRKTDLEAKSHTGQAIVIPAWKVMELLNMEVFMASREESDREMAEKQTASPVERDALRPKEAGEIAPDAFEEALRRASRKISQPESESDET